MRNPFTLALLMCAPLLVSGCGQKGPLYLPKGDSAKPPAETPAETTTEPTAGE